jgi:hypothetical protein
VTVDQRTVLAELLTKRLGAAGLANVFPGFNTSPASFLGLAS